MPVNANNAVVNGNGTNNTQAQMPQRPSKPPPPGPAPPAPVTNPQTNANNTNGTAVAKPPQNTHTPPPNLNGNHNQKGKKKAEQPVDPAAMYESLKNRIAALEEEEVHADEEERRITEEAHSSVRGLEQSAIQSKYIELFAEMKRVEREHSKEKQKLVKDKDTAKSQLTKANQTKAKMENLARELQKDNKKLREDSKRLVQTVEEAQGEIAHLKEAITRRTEQVIRQEAKYRESPDIVVKVVCKYRAELFFKISRKTKLSRLFNAWTDRMEGIAAGTAKKSASSSSSGGAQSQNNKDQINGLPSGKGSDAGSASTNTSTSATAGSSGMSFLFMHNGRSLESDLTPEDAGMDEGDEIVAVEMMDLTQTPAPDDAEEIIEPHRQRLQKNWTENPQEAKQALEDIFEAVVRERLKEVLRQYEVREKHFECVVRSKELEVLLSRARAAEQKQLAETDRLRLEKVEDENNQLKKELRDIHSSQTLLVDKLIQCCKELTLNQPNTDRTQKLFTSLRDELERRGTKMADGPMGG